MVLCRNGDGCGEARDEADCVSESGRIDAMAPGPLAGCDATSMILNSRRGGYESTSASCRIGQESYTGTALVYEGNGQQARYEEQRWRGPATRKQRSRHES